mmetsp:Transcript_53617/g.152796  ORF Transcript_53617/g.152796 Transcript_53617/m.152796 type:complete len:220 (-) Transcript_53617:397-1056(-)
MDGPSNCIVSSGFHAICCISECTALMSAVERGLRAPEAPPEAVAALVAALPSSTMPAHRTLSGLQLIRLRRIAGDNGGHVPIHGRLFAQWMHHAYPRECPYPHLAGSTKPSSVYGKLDAGEGKSIVASHKEMEGEASVRQRKGAPLESAPWVHAEELVDETAYAAVRAARPPAWMLVHGATDLAACVTLLMVLSRIAWLRVTRSRRTLTRRETKPTQFL